MDGSSAARMRLKADVGLLGRGQMQHRQLLDSFFQIPVLTTLSQTGLLVPSPPLPTSVLILCTSSPFRVDLVYRDVMKCPISK